MSEQEAQVFEDKLKEFVKNNGLAAEHLVFRRSVHTVQEAAKAVGATSRDFVKSVVMIAGGAVAVAVVLGDDRASPRLVGSTLGSPNVRAATAREVLRHTGYPAGGVPPFGYAAEVLVDPRVLTKASLFCGGGSPRALLKLTPDELLRASGGRVAQVGEVSSKT